jgi:hypothetical protein
MQLFFTRIRILCNALMGVGIRVWFSIWGFHKINGLNTSPREKKIIISLTSYGRRVHVTLYYVLISLLRQRFKPDKIVVWLDSDHWNIDNLPRNLVEMKNLGVEFRFCEDIRSYKKLIPSLIEFQNDHLVTTDDDAFYRAGFLKDLHESFLKYPDEIHVAIAHKPLRDESGKLCSYKAWPKNIKPTRNEEIFPTGVGGCFYPAGSLYPDVTKKELFMTLCPTADDIWFWAMAKMQKTGHVLVKTKKYLPLDWFYEYTHTDTALTHVNVHQNANDKQIKQVIDYYHLN